MRRALLPVYVVVLASAVAVLAGRGLTDAAELTPGAWTIGGGLGFLRDTPDDTAVALNLNVDFIVVRAFRLVHYCSLASRET